VGRKDCEEFRDHLIELRLASVASPKNPEQQPVDLAAHRAAMKQAFGEEFLGSCERTLKPKQIKCALAATESASATSCTASVSK